jgi:hypothetical protein
MGAAAIARAIIVLSTGVVAHPSTETLGQASAVVDAISARAEIEP